MWGTAHVEAQEAVSEGQKEFTDVLCLLIAVPSSQNSFRSVFWVMALTPPWTLGTVKWSCGCAAAYNIMQAVVNNVAGFVGFQISC